MSGSIVFCRMCKTPLSGRDQFLGHQIISHELAILDAENAWKKCTCDDYKVWRD